MPEGDSIRRAAERIATLEGEVVAAEAYHPRSQVLGIASAIDGLRLESVETRGKNILLRFEGGRVVRSHLMMKGRWVVERRGTTIRGRPWLVLRSRDHQAVLWNGPVLELGEGRLRDLGPDILAEPLATEEIVRRLRRLPAPTQLGIALLDQQCVAGIGNYWRAEALFAQRLSPWQPVASTADQSLEGLLAWVAEAMSRPRAAPAVYRRAGRPCSICGTLISSRPQGEAARMAYWCPACQAGTVAPVA